MQTIAVYPGTFDPITNGHLDIITRAAKLFDLVIIGVGDNISKKHLFSTQTRLKLVRQATSHLDNVTVKPFSKMLVDFAKENEASVIVRGIRDSRDFLYEQQMAIVNKELQTQIETVFLVAAPQISYVSSSIIKDIYFHDGDISAYVPVIVEQALALVKREQTNG